MIIELNDKDKTRYIITTIILIVVLIVTILFSIMVGQYDMTMSDILQALSNIIFKTTFDINPTNEKVIQFIRLPRTIAAFMVCVKEHFCERLILQNWEE